MENVLERINAFVWGVPSVVLILGTGIYLTWITGFAQFRLFPDALRSFWRNIFPKTQQTQGVSSFQALCTALAATVGTGNIAGVAGAIAIGGPGAVFWMWICSFLGMITKFAEATLAVRYHSIGADGQYVGGPMHMIQNGLGNRWRFLATTYCVFGVVAAFGVGNATQINALMDGFHSALDALGYDTSVALDFVVGLILAFAVYTMLLGGAMSIGIVAEKLVPFVSGAYILMGICVILLRIRCVPAALQAVVSGAFDPAAVTGGVLGSVLVSLRTGVSRGVFSNEAGMGTASIAYGSADTDHPVKQGLMGIMEVFLDTTVICTITALAILCSGIGVYYGIDEGAALTTRAFGSVFGDWIAIPMALFLCCFAFATLLGWGLYGARCAQFLFGDRALRFFVLLQACAVFFSVFAKTGTVWLLAEIVNGLMAVPNLIAVLYLSPELTRLIKDYQKKPGR